MQKLAQVRNLLVRYPFTSPLKKTEKHCIVLLEYARVSQLSSYVNLLQRFYVWHTQSSPDPASPYFYVTMLEKSAGEVQSCSCEVQSCPCDIACPTLKFGGLGGLRGMLIVVVFFVAKLAPFFPWIVTFGESFVANARFGSLDSHFW